ncbi:hypothetical protein [Mesorhizobium sp. M1348]|uniref:hypothetical protein n=1 Tax=Mesorhizobium sp. M1348 TaxID=2957089 RepID=UPI00333DC8FF
MYALIAEQWAQKLARHIRLVSPDRGLGRGHNQASWISVAGSLGLYLPTPSDRD